MKTGQEVPLTVQLTSTTWLGIKVFSNASLEAASLT